MSTYDPDIAHYDLMSRLARMRISVQTISHQAEGNTVRASTIRHHRLEDATKSIVVRVRITRKERLYVIAVVCGHQRVDLDRIARYFVGVDARFADQKKAESLTRCVSGCVMPLAQNEELHTIADQSLLERPVIWFNSGRLDHSIGLRPKDWLALAAPHIDRIAENKEPTRLHVAS